MLNNVQRLTEIVKYENEADFQRNIKITNKKISLKNIPYS